MVTDDGPFADLIAQGATGAIGRPLRCAAGLPWAGNDGEYLDGKAGPHLGA